MSIHVTASFNNRTFVFQLDTGTSQVETTCLRFPGDYMKPCEVFLAIKTKMASRLKGNVYLF